MSKAKHAKYRWVLSAYPAEYRAAVGHELVDTANALTGGRWSVRQSVGLLAGGLRTRERLSTGGDWKRSAATGLGIGFLVGRLAVGLTVLLLLSGVQSLEYTMDQPGGLPLWLVALLALIEVGLLVRSTRRPTLICIALIEVSFIVALAFGLSGDFGASLSQLIPIELASLWFIDRFGDGRGVLTGKSVGVASVSSVALSFVMGDPALPGVAIVLTLVVGVLFIRLRPTWAFAATSLFLPFATPDASLVGLAISASYIAVAASLGYVAIRSLRRIERI